MEYDDAANPPRRLRYRLDLYAHQPTHGTRPAGGSYLPDASPAREIRAVGADPSRTIVDQH
ncbi:MAG: hypothetical protein ABEL76_15485, partial [Bradymonadaceae bacterium]